MTTNSFIISNVIISQAAFIELSIIDDVFIPQHFKLEIKG